MKRILYLFLYLFLSCHPSFSQPVRFYPIGPVNPSIPLPSTVLGYELGSRFTDYRNQEQYLNRLTASCDRVKRVFYGETYEHRPLQILIISSPRNLAQLEEIRTGNLKLTDPRSLSKSDGDRLTNSLPAIVWLSYGVHGNEASSTEAAIAVAYQLCAGTDERTTAILDNIVTIIDPSINPDGRERYVHWINGMASQVPNANPEALEHSEPWPGGRTNHYFFDLNRDWAWQTQQESRARIKLYRSWMPQTHVDYHEMGYTSSYFFFPATAPFHEALPSEVKKWGEIYGKGNAEAFDRIGAQYYVGEEFDMFYPGYGDSWPTFNGAVGMTYEQAGHSRGGLAVRKPNGHVLTLWERARNHFTTSIASLETTVKHRRERLEDFLKYWRSAVDYAGTVKGFLLEEGSDPGRASRLVSGLLSQGIEVHQLQEPARIEARRFFSKKTSRDLFPIGTYYVSLRQPQGRLAQALLEPQAAVRDTFYYDVSAWSMPVAYGLQASSTESGVPASARILTDPPLVHGQVSGGKAHYAYLIPWERHKAATVAWQLLERGYSLSYATRQFEMGGRAFRAGTVVVFVGQNGDSLYADLERLASTEGVDIYSSNTGLAEKGISLGSDRIRPFKKPTVAVVAESPVSSNDFGELWYLMEQEYRIPFTAIRASELTHDELEHYNVIIIPDAGDLRQVIDSAGVDRLKRWMTNGGMLIGIDGAARFFVKSKSGLTAGVLQSDKKDEDKTKEEKEQEKAKKESAMRQSLFEKEEYHRLAAIPGTIYRVNVDTTHPIGFGMPPEIFVFKQDGIPLELTESGHTVARFSNDSTEVSGYARPDRSKKIAGTAYIQDFKIGKGRAILFAESVTFRMFWVGLNKLLINAILFLPEP